ncbi:FAD-dependent oxidoreductase [Desulfovibrio sp. OttesenSCG-928-C06]|nr:FAD-dependent oxidoreductase [Desulfovibrio sp. OttesenSCG-928-C06]
MPRQLFARKVIKTDVLVVGGGLAGCSAAIRAAEKGASVLLVDKSHVRRSGNAATGVDHTWCYLPEVHDPQGFTPEQLVEDHIAKMGPVQDQDIIHAIACNIGERIKEMEGWGMPFKTDGEYRFVKKIHRVPTFLHWAGRDQKVIFERQLRKLNVETMNRVMIFELLKQDGRVVGAIGVGTREPVIYIFIARSVVVATGGISRMFPAKHCMDFNRQRYPYGSGDGIAMGIRAGAEVVRMEFFNRWTGLAHFFKSGRGTWIGVLEDASGTPLSGEAVAGGRSKMTTGVENHGKINQFYREGRGPIYMNCGTTSDEDFDYMCWALSNEGNQLLLQQARELGIDFHHKRIEFEAYDAEMTGGYCPDVSGRTNVPGLFAGGGEVIGNMKRSVSPGSFAFGKIAGESAAIEALGQELADPARNSDEIDRNVDRLEQMLKRSQGASWQEASGACQNIMGHYCCETKYENLLVAGQEQLARVRRRAEHTLAASCQHELVRCLEALNLMEIAEASLTASLERKETRQDSYDPFRRVDYTEENPEMRKFLVYSKEDGKHRLHWRSPRTIS